MKEREYCAICGVEVRPLKLLAILFGKKEYNGLYYKDLGIVCFDCHREMRSNIHTYSIYERDWHENE